MTTSSEPDYSDLLNLFASLPPPEQEQVLRNLTTEERVQIDQWMRQQPQIQQMSDLWTPQPGRQQEAYDCPADELYYGGAQGGGKALDRLTPLATPFGWTDMGSVQVGSILFDERGQPCKVVATSEVFLDHPCYRVNFDDGNYIIADSGHLWWTFTSVERAACLRRSEEWRAKRRAGRESRGTGKRPDLTARNSASPPTTKPTPSGSVRTTAEISASLIDPSRGRNHSIPLAGALVLPTLKLPLHPYVLGAWLGDGKTVQGKIYTHEDDVAIVQRIESLGYPVRKVPSEEMGWTILGIQPILRGLGVLGSKHIPPAYLLASIEQRQELLCGLMDTDGCCNTDGGAEFTSVKEELATGVLSLAQSLGIKATMIVGRAMLNGRDCGKKYRIKMTTDVKIFTLARKAIRQHLQVSPTRRHRYIVGCWPLDPIPVRCIQVDSPSGLFLAGKGLVPTHNSDLILGLAATKHYHSVIFRRTFPLHRTLIERSREILNPLRIAHHRDMYNESLHRWMLPEGQLIEFGSIEYEKDKEDWRGRPHDLYAFDEVSQFTESQFRFVKAWCRSVRPGQRCRVVVTGNPPSTVEGEWVIRYWAPWLDRHHPNQAMPGELRWFTRIEDEDVECPSGESFEVIDKRGRKEWVTPKSRTFIPALLSDNPILERRGYLAQLQMLPEPLRTQAIYGDHSIGLLDDAWQVIPTDWVRAAQKRWRPNGGQALACTALGVDCFYGGSDLLSIARRHQNWFAPLVVYKGPQAQSHHAGEGEASAELVIREHRDRAEINVDAIGYGAATVEMLRKYERIARSCAINAVNVAESSHLYDKSGRLPLTNKRAALYWKFREALDPINGASIALPPDRELEAELCSVRYRNTAAGIKLEEKADTKERVGRSPDRADSVVLCWGLHLGSSVPDPRLLEKLDKEMTALYAGKGPTPESEDDPTLSEEERQRGARSDGSDPALESEPWTAHQYRRKWFGRDR